MLGFSKNFHGMSLSHRGTWILGEESLEIFDDFSDKSVPEITPPDTATSDDQSDSHQSVSDASSGSNIDRLTVESVRHRSFRQGSLPDLTTSDSDVYNNELSSSDNFRHSSPQIHVVVEGQLPSDTVSSADDSDKRLSIQTHHATAPCLQDLKQLGDPCQEPDSIGQAGNSVSSDGLLLTSPTMKFSFSHDGLENDGKMEVDSEVITRRSPFSKIRSGLSQVSQLIIHQSASPHARRRRQILEAQLLDNHMKSNEQFKNCKTRILLL